MSDLATKIERITPELVAMAAWQTGLPVARCTWGYRNECGCPITQIVLADPHGQELENEDIDAWLASQPDDAVSEADVPEALEWVSELTVVNSAYDEGFIHGVDGDSAPYFGPDDEEVDRAEIARGFADGVAVREALQIPKYSEAFV